ncbi:MAG TPA: hypothetical protein ENJ95_02115 [Bacteroidetes bacterium]|nr:hypothetical protein [Bacteroidota bacterium]
MQAEGNICKSSILVNMTGLLLFVSIFFPKIPERRRSREIGTGLASPHSAQIQRLEKVRRSKRRRSGILGKKKVRGY